MLHYINPTGKSVMLHWKNEKYFIPGWSQIDLPEEIYEHIESQNIPLELDYQLYIAEMESHFDYSDPFSLGQHYWNNIPIRLSI